MPQTLYSLIAQHANRLVTHPKYLYLWVSISHICKCWLLLRIKGSCCLTLIWVLLIWLRTLIDQSSLAGWCGHYPVGSFRIPDFTWTYLWRTDWCLWQSLTLVSEFDDPYKQIHKKKSIGGHRVQTINPEHSSTSALLWNIPITTCSAAKRAGR